MAAEDCIHILLDSLTWLTAQLISFWLFYRSSMMFSISPSAFFFPIPVERTGRFLIRLHPPWREEQSSQVRALNTDRGPMT